jgi:glycosyltransferase involved in cell wall biosynthesis
MKLTRLARWLKHLVFSISISRDDAPFADFVKSHLDREAYLEAYPDVRKAGLDPVRHWLEHGMAEGRFLYPNSIVVLDDTVDRLDDTSWDRFTWRGRPAAVRRLNPLKPSLLGQIMAQACHEPAILAAGALAINRLRQFDGADLLMRDGVDVRTIFAAIPDRPDWVVLMPRLCVGGAEKFAADLIDGIESLCGARILVVVTDETIKMARGWESLRTLAPFRSVRVVFWPDICGPNCHEPKFLARFLNVLRPSRILVVNSRIGLDMVSGFGRALSQFAKLYCTYFSLSKHGLGAPYGARFPSRTLPFSAALTDNGKMAATLRRQWGDIPGPGIAILPPRLQPAEDHVISARRAARRMRVGHAPRPLRWTWVSRVEPLKGTGVLAELARMRPADQFDIFGPIEGDLSTMGLKLPNITHRGLLEDVSSADFTDYDGFLLTSPVEGMPNTVLEMGQHAIPMILSDVGGLRDTFDDAAVRFVGQSDDTLSMARAFSGALDDIAALGPSEADAMTEAARTQSLSRHAPDVYLKNVSDLFEIES